MGGGPDPLASLCPFRSAPCAAPSALRRAAAPRSNTAPPAAARGPPRPHWLRLAPRRAPIGCSAALPAGPARPPALLCLHPVSSHNAARRARGGAVPGAGRCRPLSVRGGAGPYRPRWASLDLNCLQGHPHLAGGPSRPGRDALFGGGLSLGAETRRTSAGPAWGSMGLLLRVLRKMRVSSGDRTKSALHQRAVSVRLSSGCPVCRDGSPPALILVVPSQPAQVPRNCPKESRAGRCSRCHTAERAAPAPIPGIGARRSQTVFTEARRAPSLVLLLWLSGAGFPGPYCCSTPC